MKKRLNYFTIAIFLPRQKYDCTFSNYNCRLSIRGEADRLLEKTFITNNVFLQSEPLLHRSNAKHHLISYKTFTFSSALHILLNQENQVVNIIACSVDEWLQSLPHDRKTLGVGCLMPGLGKIFIYRKLTAY